MDQQLAISAAVATQSVNQLVNQSFHHIDMLHRLANSSNQFISCKSLRYNQEVCQQGDWKAQSNLPQSEEIEVKPLRWDNLFPKAAHINSKSSVCIGGKMPAGIGATVKDPESTYESNTALITNVQNKHPSLQPSPIEQQFKGRSQQNQSDKESLRQTLQLRHGPIQSGRTRIKKIEHSQIDKKERNVGFDYDGKPVVLKQSNRKNLICTGLKGTISQQVDRTKGGGGGGGGGDFHRINNKSITKEQTRSRTARVDHVVFSNTQRLFASAKAHQGIKLLEAGTVIQNKKRALSTSELKKRVSLGTHQLNRQEYIRIKGVSAIVTKDKESTVYNNLKIEKMSQNKKNRSVPKLFQAKLSHSQLRKSAIKVTDLRLLQNLLPTPTEQIPQPITTNKMPQPNILTTQLASIDHKNLEIIRTGGDMATTQNSMNFPDIFKFASFSYTGLKSATASIPRSREKVKNGHQAIRETRKRFEQKLRL